MNPTDGSDSKLPEFAEIMGEFKKKFPVEPQGRVEKGSSIRSKASWEEVLGVIGNVAAAYAAKTGIKGKLKAIGTFIEDNTDTIERLSRIVPDIDYAKPIVGTLTFVLQVSIMHIAAVCKSDKSNPS
jgi:hypothetical protein